MGPIMGYTESAHAQMPSIILCGSHMGMLAGLSLVRHSSGLFCTAAKVGINNMLRPVVRLCKAILIVITHEEIRLFISFNLITVITTKINSKKN